MDKLFYTLIVAAIGGLIGIKLKLPAGPMIGAMFAVGIYNLLGKQAYLPDQFKLGIQIAAGAMIGLNINLETLHGLKTMWLPALIMVLAVLVISFGIGFLIYKFAGWDLSTALFASAPGGMTEMTLAADAMGADAPKVAMLQLMRLLCIVSFLPFILKAVIRLLAKQ